MVIAERTPKLFWKVGSEAGAEIKNMNLAWTGYIKIKPTPRQLAFLLAPALEIFYGGAGGGGKSIALLTAALQYADTPGYSALILRRTFTDLALPGALMDVAHQWLSGTNARWDDTQKTWTFPRSGASLVFGYLDSPRDKYRYQSSQFQYIGFDELTHFPKDDYLFLFSRLRRSSGSDVPLRMRSASNPGGSGHDWVRERFIDSPPDKDRIFIRAGLADNPYIDIEQYRRSLIELDPITRKQIENGDWSARQSGKFHREWFEIVDIAPAEIASVRCWDCAATEARAGKDPDWTVGLRLGRTANNVLYIMDVRRMRGTPMATEQLIKQTAVMDGKSVKIRMEQEPGSSGVKAIDDYRRRVLMGYEFRGVPATGSKEIRANPVASQAEAGNIKIVRGPWNAALLDELELFPGGSHDDQVDSLSGALDELTGGGRPFLIG